MAVTDELFTTEEMSAFFETCYDNGVTAKKAAVLFLEHINQKLEKENPA